MPVLVTIRPDRSFEPTVKTPSTAALLRRAAGSSAAARNLDAAERTVAGTARSMGLTIKD